MPKAAIITHLRMTIAALGFKKVFCIQDTDVLYTVLPLYHSAGGMIGAGLMINGVTMILRDRWGPLGLPACVSVSVSLSVSVCDLAQVLHDNRFCMLVLCLIL